MPQMSLLQDLGAQQDWNDELRIMGQTTILNMQIPPVCGSMPAGRAAPLSLQASDH